MDRHFKKIHPDTRPRLNVDISEDQKLALVKLIPWGLKNTLFGVIVDDIIELLSEPLYRDKFIAIIIARKMDALAYSKTFKVIKENNSE